MPGGAPAPSTLTGAQQVLAVHASPSAWKGSGFPLLHAACFRELTNEP
jgi:hypothetical protein